MSFCCTALNNCTGTLTRPKLIAPFHIDLGMPARYPPAVLDNPG